MGLITCLASSSRGNGYVLKDGNAGLILEAGAPLKKYAPHIVDINDVLITHSHGDHARNAGKLADFGQTIHATAATLEALELDGEEITINEWQEINGVSVFAFEADHDCPGAVNFILGFEKHSVLFATDTARIGAYFLGVTHLMLECNHDLESLDFETADQHIYRAVDTHLSLQSLLLYLENFDLSTAKEIYLIHMSRDNINEKQARDAVQAATGVPVFVCKENGGIK